MRAAPRAARSLAQCGEDPAPPGIVLCPTRTLRAPAHDLLHPEKWPAEVEVRCRSYRETTLARYLQFASLTMVKQTKSRGTGPKRTVADLELVCEWAVRHYCLGESWPAIAKSALGYTPNQVKKNGLKVLKTLQLEY
jgi:hypothetical protein